MFYILSLCTLSRGRGAMVHILFSGPLRKIRISLGGMWLHWLTWQFQVPRTRGSSLIHLFHVSSQDSLGFVFQIRFHESFLFPNLKHYKALLNATLVKEEVSWALSSSVGANFTCIAVTNEMNVCWIEDWLESWTEEATETENNKTQHNTVISFFSRSSSSVR